MAVVRDAEDVAVLRRASQLSIASHPRLGAVLSARPTKALLTRVFALLGVALVLGGCTQVAKLMVPSDRFTFTVGGMERSYRLYKPKGLPGTAPLVVVLHALGANTINAEQSMGWDKRADVGEFVVAYPEGIGWTWNAHGCCGKAAEQNVDDVAFISAMVDRISGIDRSRVYATGLSNGGLMAYTLACTTSLFAAIGVAEASQVGPCTNPHPTSVIAFHNLDDPIVKFGGTAQAKPSLVDLPPIPDVIAFWRHVDACGPPTETEADSRKTSTADCADGRQVVLVTMPNGGHKWTAGIEKDIAKFFAAHHM